MHVSQNERRPGEPTASSASLPPVGGGEAVLGKVRGGGGGGGLRLLHPLLSQCSLQTGQVVSCDGCGKKANPESESVSAPSRGPPSPKA